MMSNKQISVNEALKRLQEGKKLKGLVLDFKNAKIKALDAFKLGKAGVEVPDELIVYDDTEVAHDLEFDGYEWKRTDLDPFNSVKEGLVVHLKIEKDVQAWIQKNGIEVDHLLEKLIHDFYASNQMIKGG